MTIIKAFASLVILFASAATALASNVTPEIVKELAPSGTLRAAINYGNAVLAQKDPATGAPRGATPDLARNLAQRLGVPVALVPYDSGGKLIDGLHAHAWDVAFIAIDPARATELDFTAPFLIIEGTYVVRADSPLRTIEDVDRDGVRIAVGQGSAHDLHLTRALKHAKLVREPSATDALAAFVNDRLDAAAGLRQAVTAFAKTHPGMRVMDGHFLVIEQAMATPKGRDAGARYLRGFVEEMKASGFIAEALQRSGQGNATVAPPAPAK